MTTPSEIAESYINGNQSWVKTEIMKAENPKIIAEVYNELKEFNEPEANNFMNWIIKW